MGTLFQFKFQNINLELGPKFIAKNGENFGNLQFQIQN